MTVETELPSPGWELNVPSENSGPPEGSKPVNILYILTLAEGENNLGLVRCRKLDGMEVSVDWRRI